MEELKYTHAKGFEPVYNEGSRVLILGSFPSVKSRKIDFYYGNRQNRFWRTVCGFFGECVPEGTADKIAFLHRRGIALWDVIMECDIVGSSDASIKNEKIADVSMLLRETGIGCILCNGNKSYELLIKYFPDLAAVAVKLPSTSPANPRFSATVWEETLRSIFPAERPAG